jgi:hypothetical protein
VLIIGSGGQKITKVCVQGYNKQGITKLLDGVVEVNRGLSEERGAEA